MKILVLTGVLFPQPSNNANLISRLIPFLAQQHTVHILAQGKICAGQMLPDKLYNVPVHWVQETTSIIKKRLLYPAVTKLIDNDGYSDAIGALRLEENLKKLRETYHYDVIIATMEPYDNGIALKALPAQLKKIIYMMDPPTALIEELSETKFRKKSLPSIIKTADIMLTTPAISDALHSKGYITNKVNIVRVGFPLVQDHEPHRTEADVSMNTSKINLLFCGWLYGGMRSPEYFVKLLSGLDERFCVYFIGQKCDLFFERYEVDTKAQIICMPQQTYQVALNAMMDADVLVNIGNSVPIHMPSKVLEYINTGKPIVNFSKRIDCPSKYFTSRYPNCLELYEQENDICGASARLRDFCLDAKKKSPIDRDLIKQLYPECTPEYIASMILEYLKQ